jgi:multiple sugar transport system substrate-binding protein
MKTSTRRRMLGVASAALAAGLITAGCGSSSAKATSSSGSSAHVTLTVWTYYTGPDQLKALAQQDALFEKSHHNVTVKEVQVAGTELDPKLLASAAAKSGPDVFLDNVVVDFPELTAAGALAPLTSDWNSYPGKAQYPAAGIWKTNGQIYNVMSYSNLLGLYYNKTILNQYHLQAPTTTSQFVSDMAVIAKAGKYSPLAASADPQPDGAWTWYPILLDNGVNYCNTTATNMIPMFQTVADWTKAGYLPKAAATWSQSDSWTQFMSGKYAFGINGNWNLGDASAAKFSWGTTQLPGPNGTSHVFPGGEGLGIGAFSKIKQLDWEYLETAWLSQQANIIDFEDSGQIPTRADVAETAQVKADTAAAPFIAATKTVSAWPHSSKTDEMQISVATELSDVVSGQASPSSAASAASKAIVADIKAGGGDC